MLLPHSPAFRLQVAYHRFTATWLGYRDGVRPQAKDTVRAMFCKDCTEVRKYWIAASGLDIDSSMRWWDIQTSLGDCNDANGCIAYMVGLMCTGGRPCCLCSDRRTCAICWPPAGAEAVSSAAAG